MRRVSFGLVILASLLSSCSFMGGKRARGDGNVISQTRTASNFKSIDVSGAYTVVVTQDAAYSVKIEADANLQELIESRVDGSTLRIKTRDNFNLDPSKEIMIYISAPLYEHLEASGACNFQSQNQLVTDGTLEIDMSGACESKLDIKAAKVDVDMSGACAIEFKGAAKDFKVGGSGSTHVKAFDFITDNTDVDISGAGEVEVTANVKLHAEASGAGDIRYKGTAAVSSETSGAGSVKKVD